MNYLELQQRANLLVDKVNQYEASLTETTFNETEILNQHLYADIYSLRPVLKMLFGKTIDDKLSRTLLNDVDLRVFASSSPMWNSSFNLLSAVPSPELPYTITPYTSNYYYIGDLGHYQASATRTKSNSYSAVSQDIDIALLEAYNNANKDNIEFIFKVTTAEVAEASQYIIGTYYYNTAGIGFTGGKWRSFGNDIYIPDKTVKPNTTYYVKLINSKELNTDWFLFAISEDGVNFTEPIQTQLPRGEGLLLGRRWNSNNYNLKGSIDLLNSTVNLTLNNNNQISNTFKLFDIENGTYAPIYSFFTSNNSSIAGSFIVCDAASNKYAVMSKSASSGNSYIYLINDDSDLQGTGSYINLEFNTTIGLSDNSSRNPADFTIYPRTSNSSLNRILYSDITINHTEKTITITTKGEQSGEESLTVTVAPNTVINWNINIEIIAENKFTVTWKYYIPSTGETSFKSYTATSQAIVQGIQNGLLLYVPTYYGADFPVCYGLGNITAMFKQTAFSVDYQSNNRHEFMNDINMYNANNMIVQDAQINSILNRNSRIASGLNYSYSSNIQDALVTESQVANIFKWNTTTDKEIYNNTLTINRQVPGLVCYYLGNGYNGTYTATIPYAPRFDNINSVNYSTPVYYGAFYRNDDVEQSQVGLNMGAECCRIFMPGMNYTRGKLQSPQQIWQPDKRVGQDNIGYGFNWQGQAIYHELVFKNRRQGCQAKGLDFIPSISSDEDNDPQGLALRTALAQQKQFYYNRPFFDELTELNGVNITKLVEEIGNASRTEYTPHYTIVGNPTISDDFILSNTGNRNYIDTNYTASGFNSIEINFDVLFTDFNSTYYMTGQVDSHNYTCPQLASTKDGNLNLACSYNGSSWIYLYNTDVVLDLNTRYNLRVGWKNETKKWYGILTDVSTGEETNLGEVDCAQAPLFSYPLEICYDQGKPTYIQSGLTIYLDTFKITVNNNVDYQAVTSQVVPLDDEAFFRDYKLDYDTWATALDKPL